MTRLSGKRVVVIGAGLGGLASACRLAADGAIVDVVERTSSYGGKCNRFSKSGYHFDTGPSLVTMPFVLDELFSACGTTREQYLEMIPVEPTCRYYFGAGEPLDLYADQSKNTFSAQSKAELSGFLKHSKSLWDKTADAFVLNPLYEWRDLAGLKWKDLLDIDAFSSLSSSVDGNVTDPKLRQILKRFATYNGSDPWQTPATLNVIAHVELNMGAFYPKGGLRAIPDALHNLATNLGVRFHFDATVSGVSYSGRRATCVTTANGAEFPCDILVSNTDTRWFYENLMPQTAKNVLTKRFSTMEPSCSGFVLLLGMKRQYPALLHHTIFFSDDYRAEFAALFNHKIPAEKPTVYVANTSFSDPADAPYGCSNLFVLVNAPYTSDAFLWNEERTAAYTGTVLASLEKSIPGFRHSDIEVIETITPQDFESRYLTNSGSIYGYSSNSRFAAFLRPRNRVRKLENVYLTGGSTHPGGGIPLVLTSAKHVQTLVHRAFSTP
jgi:phytoene desaturase